MHTYYVYLHRRKDTNTIFYVGIARKNPLRNKGEKTEYERAYKKANRSDFWKNIVAKTKYSVEIFMESSDENLVKNVEIELIKYYGRKAYDTDGILVNFDIGGGLNVGPKRRNNPITQLSIDETIVKYWDEVSIMIKETGFTRSNIVKCCRGKQLTAHGYKWQYTNHPDFLKFNPITSARGTKFKFRNQIELWNKDASLLAICKSVVDVAKLLGINSTIPHKYLKGALKHPYIVIKRRTIEKRQDFINIDTFIRPISDSDIRTLWHNSTRGKKAVLQFTKEGNFIKEYASAKEAADYIHVDRHSINAVCRKERFSAGGFIWKYKF